MANINVLMYAVYEEQKRGMRIWYKNFHKGFLLRHELKPNAKFANPIKLVINNAQMAVNGDYK
jgi:hypothetical protein